MRVLLSDVRIYANAIFDLAWDQRQFSRWEAFLRASKQMVLAFPRGNIWDTPQIAATEKFALFSEIISDFAPGANLISLLLRKRKLSLLPAIASRYEELFYRYNNTLKVKVVVSSELSEEQKSSLIEVFRRRHGGEVVLRFEVDASILGGIVLSLGERIVDYSLRRRLHDLKKNLFLKSAYNARFQ